MAVANADLHRGHLLDDPLRRELADIEAESWDAFMDARLLGDAVDGCTAVLQHLQHLAR